MSNWTHVAGVIRIDDLRLSNKLPDFDRLIGKECSFSDLWSDKGDELEKYPEKFLPLGSEGTLNKSIWINPNESCIAAYTVSIFGDLRDHDDAMEIITWFKNKCKEIDEDNYMIRNAVITVENERNGTKTYTYQEDENNIS